jgi:hypothetical protein
MPDVTDRDMLGESARRRYRATVTTPDRSAALLRFARYMLRVQVAGIVLGVVVIVYGLGFQVHPHKVGFALVIAAIYLVLASGVTLLLQRSWRAQARRAAASNQ